jgi:hypothetical protein
MTHSRILTEFANKDDKIQGSEWDGMGRENHTMGLPGLSHPIPWDP